MFNFLKKSKPVETQAKTPNAIAQLAIFNIQSCWDKLYKADGKEEVLLSANEAGDLLDYLDYVGWLTNPPKDSPWKEELENRVLSLLRKK